MSIQVLAIARLPAFPHAPTKACTSMACAAKIIYMTASLVSSIYLMKWAISQLDPNRAQLDQAKKRQKALEQQLGRPLLQLQGLEAVPALAR